MSRKKAPELMMATPVEWPPNSGQYSTDAHMLNPVPLTLQDQKQFLFPRESIRRTRVRFTGRDVPHPLAVSDPTPIIPIEDELEDTELEESEMTREEQLISLEQPKRRQIIASEEEEEEPSRQKRKRRPNTPPRELLIPTEERRREREKRREKKRRKETGDAAVPTENTGTPPIIDLTNEEDIKQPVRRSTRRGAGVRAFSKKPNLFESFQTTVAPSSIPNGGQGLWTTQPIPKGTEIGQFVGEELTKEAYNRRYPTDEGLYVVQFQRTNVKGDIVNRFIDQSDKNKSNFMRYMNTTGDAKHHNVVVHNVEDSVAAKAKKDIPAGTELFWEYGDEYHWGGVQPGNPDTTAPIPERVTSKETRKVGFVPDAHLATGRTFAVL